MRRGMLAAVMVALLAASGCGVPEGTDGDLLDDWPGLPEPSMWIPEAGACYSVEAVGSNRGVVPCAEPHLTETVHVGAFDGEAAAAASPPPWYEQASRAAHQSCDDAARNFLGDNWQAGRLLLTVSVPAKDTWSAGGRWFRCDLRELDNDAAIDATGVPRRGSLRNGLRGQRPLARSCYTADLPVDCSTRHELESAGLFHLTVAAYADVATTQRAARDGCLGVVARFVNVSRAQYRKYADWVVGATHNGESGHPVRVFRCFVQAKQTVNRSLKGVGPAGMP